MSQHYREYKAGRLEVQKPFKAETEKQRFDRTRKHCPVTKKLRTTRRVLKIPHQR